MTPIRILSSSLLCAAVVSCASQKADEYDTTGNPYGIPDAGMDPAMAAQGNPIYDTPAAYEDSAYTTPAVPGVPAVPSVPAVAPEPAAGPAVIHTVVKGDTLSGLSSKYNVPMESIKQANRMTNDTVVLGRKMVIPPH